MLDLRLECIKINIKLTFIRVVINSLKTKTNIQKYL